MRTRIYTVKLPTDAITPVDIPIEGPFAAAVGAVSTPTVVPDTLGGTNGFFAEWRNRPLSCPNKLSLGAAQFVPRFRLGFAMSTEVVAQPTGAAAISITQRLVPLAAGSTLVGAGGTVTAGPFVPSTATARFQLSYRVTDGVNVGGFGYGPGPKQVAVAGPIPYVSADLLTDAGGVVIRFTNNDGANAHTVAWAILEVDPGSAIGAWPVPQTLCSQSLVGSVLTSSTGATSAGDGTLVDPAGVPIIRVRNGFDVAGALVRVYLEVMEQQDEDRN